MMLKAIINTVSSRWDMIRTKLKGKRRLTLGGGGSLE